MRFSVACLSACLAPAAALSIFTGNAPDVIANDDLDIPGESPLKLCDRDHDGDILSITKVDLTPNPPTAGQELVIKARGSVKKTIEEGAYVNLTVKYGFVRLISTKEDLCKQITNVDLECPVEPGDMSITKTVELPQQIPPGKYTVLADVYTKDDKPITCLTATVEFKVGSTGFLINEL